MNRPKKNNSDLKRFIVCQPIKQLIVWVLLCLSLPANSHGGISALNGILEILIILYVLGTIVLIWLVYVLTLLFMKNISNQTFSIFRKTIYSLMGVFILLVLLLSVKVGFSADIFYLVMLIILGIVTLTELSVLLVKKVRKL